jgi:hypothetical protein
MACMRPRMLSSCRSQRWSGARWRSLACSTGIRCGWACFAKGFLQARLQLGHGASCSQDQ